MKFNQIKKIVKNPDAIKKFIQTGDKDESRKLVQINEYRKKMFHACELSDKFLDEKYSIPKIIELVSKEIKITKYPIAWYCLIRTYKPKIIVETGTSMGWSSYMILSAISRNEIGHLYSFDLNDSENVKNYGGVGYLVTEKLKDNWTLTIGDSKENLEPTLKKLIQIDMFIHDSEHSYEMMMYEYSTAWNYLKKDGILGSDDINHSDAFEDFTGKFSNDIYGLTEFEEISRKTDSEFKRPKVGYFFKKN
jgi:predicted O-methyltransferase YrrM